VSARSWLGTLGVGAALLYFLNPAQGSARRARWWGWLAPLERRVREEVDELLSRGREGRPAGGGFGSRQGDIAGLEAATLRPPAPAPRPPSDVLLAVAGGALAVYGLARRGTLATLLRTVGAGILAGSVREARPAPRRGERRRIMDVQETTHVAAPVHRVFAFWSDWANLPRFLSNVREVRDLGGGRSHWVVRGPGGRTLEWDAVVTERVPDELLAWRSVPGSTPESAGVIRFTPVEGGTRVDLRFCYNPPTGGAEATVVNLLGSDPRGNLNEDLGRMKGLLEAVT